MASSASRYEVIVVGMGPAGASTAYELQKRGVSVLGLEKYTHPREKVCGGALSARIVRILDPDFLSVVEEEVYGFRFTYGLDESYFVESSRPLAYMVMRSGFDAWLVQKAKHAGVEIHEREPVINVMAEAEGIRVITSQRQYVGQVVVGADGAKGVVTQHLFQTRPTRMVPALESEVQCDTPELGLKLNNGQSPTYAVISLNAAKKGYGWIFPKHHGLSVGVGEFVRGECRPKRSFHQFSQEEPVLQGLHVPAPLGHPIPVFQWSRIRKQRHGWLVKGRALLVGDAGHLVDPLLGEGIYYAIRSGQIAAEHITRFLREPHHPLTMYEGAVLAEFGKEFLIASRLNRIIYGVPRSWHRWIGRTFPHAYQQVLHRYCQLLQGRETYQSLWARIIRKLTTPCFQR
ncbi:MAG: NAD(P)/FAD-dependent oxidoreductase [Nitrospirae bacterium]|nr:MAG: NAD(P)/FAD-dependent oxidoreductase [Nitrospirota bacterium]